MNRAKTIVCLTLLASAGGCGQSNDLQSQSAPSPDAVIAEFLGAVRAGDDAKASSLLTPLAQKKTAEMEMVVAPPGSETATYQVQGVEMVNGSMHVAAVWTDLDADGRPHADLIVWILRQESEGWRIAGMTAKVFEDLEPVVLDFEDPADMMRKQQLAEEELARRDRQTRMQSPDASKESSATVR